MDRTDAWKLIVDNVQAIGLRRHMLAVEAAMRWYAPKLGADPEVWGLAGLLHDWDWEIHPTLDTHPAAGCLTLVGLGCDQDIVQAILAHNTEGTGVERKHPLDFALLACDEITGLISAAALVRPSKDVRDVEVKSIKKRWKEKTFAAGVDRDHVETVTADWNRVSWDGKLDLWEHVGNVLTAMQGAAAELELDGRLATAGVS